MAAAGEEVNTTAAAEEEVNTTAAAEEEVNMTAEEKAMAVERALTEKFQKSKVDVAGKDAAESQPKLVEAKIMFNYYDRTPDAIVITVRAQHIKKASQVKKEQAEAMGCAAKDLNQCKVSMRCFLKSDVAAFSQWKVSGKDEAMKEYIVWFNDNVAEKN